MPTHLPDPGDKPRFLIRDPESGCWLAFTRLRSILSAGSVEEVRDVFVSAELGTTEGNWAVGFVSYEAAPAFDPAFVVSRNPTLPLAWFALCDPPERIRTEELPPAAAYRLGDLEPTLTAADHGEGVARVHDHIERGDTYQVNYTHQLEAAFDGDPWGLFLDLWRNQRCAHAAWIDAGSNVLCSVSPELFFDLDGDRIHSRPMKGTARRGRTTAEDGRQAERLRTSPKNRAENIMIVDMIRNDLARIARPGTVRTASLCDVERYDSVFQLTSTVEAETDASVADVFSALFPCASITGAPKVRTMQLIRELESRPRGIYTGAIGWLAPGRRARFSVAIRTAAVSRQAGRLSYGTGGGIVWDSHPETEYQECLDKARILTSQQPPFSLLETLLWEPEGGFRLLARHMDRLLDSAVYFSIPVDRRDVLERLDAAAAAWTERLRVRLLVDLGGATRITSEPYAPLPDTWRLELALEPIDSSDPFLFHKTTHREVYDRALRNRPAADDVLLWNERGELTETTLANLVLEVDGERLTPPLSSGLLAGTERAELLAREKIRERTLHVADLEVSSAVYLVNSVRGWFQPTLATPLSEMKQTLALARSQGEEESRS